MDTEARRGPSPGGNWEEAQGQQPTEGWNHRGLAAVELGRLESRKNSRYCRPFGLDLGCLYQRRQGVEGGGDGGDCKRLRPEEEARECGRSSSVHRRDELERCQHGMKQDPCTCTYPCERRKRNKCRHCLRVLPPSRPHPHQKMQSKSCQESGRARMIHGH